MNKYEIWSTKPLDNEEPFEKIAEFRDMDTAIRYTDMYFERNLDVLLIMQDGKIIYAGGDHM